MNWSYFALFGFVFVAFVIMAASWQREANKWKSEYRRVQAIMDRWMLEEKSIPIEWIREAIYGPESYFSPTRKGKNRQ